MFEVSYLSIIYPMFLIIISPLCLGAYQLKIRKKAVLDKHIDGAYFKSYDPSFNPPEYIRRVGNHFNSLFQVPTIFLITCTVLLVLKIASPISLGLAWLFVILRGVHTFVHLGKNQVMKRAKVFVLGVLTIMAQWIIILVFVIRSS